MRLGVGIGGEHAETFTAWPCRHHAGRDWSAVHYTWNSLNADACFATLAAGGIRRTFQLEFQQTPYGWRAYFVGGGGVRANKAYFIPGGGFTTRSESNLQVRGRYMIPRERMKQTKAASRPARRA